jgi:hypothetical protein
MNIRVTAPPGTKPSLLTGCYAVVIYDNQKQVKSIPARVTGLLLEFPFEPDHNLIDGIIVCAAAGEVLVEIRQGIKDTPEES